MKLGVLDIGSNTVHLVVVNAHPGARPSPTASHKVVLRLMQYVASDGSINPDGVRALEGAISACLRVAANAQVEELLPMATSALREATNGAAVIDRIERHTGIRLTVLSGEQEARLTFLAVRRWLGWSAGRVMLFDIGGGSLEIAAGNDEHPDLACSVPLGAGRMTGQFFTADPPPHADVKALKQYARKVLAPPVRQFAELPDPDLVVGTSKTFRTLGALMGRPGASGLPEFTRQAIKDWIPRLEALPSTARAALPGISTDRSVQILAGAVVVRRAMKAFNVEAISVCPWALREGIILRYIDVMQGEESVTTIRASTMR